MKINNRIVEDPDERIRVLNELSLRCAQKYLSSQTGYLHYCHHQGEESVHLTIPTYENLLYVYALLKTKTFENIAESKKILQNLLCFQAESGNFPVYLHQFPQCNERLLGLELLVPLYHIYTQFKLVLGDLLNLTLKNAVIKLLKFCITSSREKALTYSKKISLAVLVNTFGNLFEIEELVESGVAFLKEIEEDGFVVEWFAPETRSQILTLFQLGNPIFSKTIWKNFWNFIQNTYDSSTGSYVGPSIHSYQFEYEPEYSIADFHYSAITGAIPTRFCNLRIIELSACLIQPYHQSISLNESFIGTVLSENKNWGYKKNQNYSLSYFQTPLDKDVPFWKGIVPFRMCWGTMDHLYSFISQGGNYQTLMVDLQKRHVVLEYQLSKDVDVEDREMKKEVICAIDQNKNTKITIKDVKATTFKLQETVKVESENFTFLMNFFLIEGEGEFFGHIMPGNRVSQLALKNETRFNAYDSLIFLRTLRRSENCRIGLKISVENE